MSRRVVGFLAFTCGLALIPAARAELFAERCAQQLGATRVDVRFEDRPVTRILSQSRSQLEALGGEVVGGHRSVLGLTRAESMARMQVKVRLLRNSDGSVCARPDIDLVLGLQRLDVYLARELRNDCQRNLVDAHEAEHVAVWRNHLRAGAQLLAPVLRERLGQIVFYPSSESAEADLKQRCNQEVGRLMAKLAEGITAEHRQIDSPGAYQMVHNSLRACP